VWNSIESTRAEGPLRVGIGIAKGVVIREDLLIATFALLRVRFPLSYHVSLRARTQTTDSIPSAMGMHGFERGNCQTNQDDPKSLQGLGELFWMCLHSYTPAVLGIQGVTLWLEVRPVNL
jgi:hypothetical protein